MYIHKDMMCWLDGLARAWGLTDTLKIQQAVFAWRRAVGPQLSSWARPSHVAGGVLHLVVNSYAAATQLRLLEDKLLDTLRSVAPDCGVVQLRLHVQPEGRASERVRDFEVTTEDWEQAALWVPDGVPEGLRDALLRVAARAAAQERAILSGGGRRCSSCGVAFRGTEPLCPVCAVVGCVDDE